MVKRKGKRNGKWLYFLLGVSVTMFVVFLFTIFNASGGDVVTKKVVIEYDGAQDTSGGYIKLERNDETPSVLDWASFKNGEKFSYFTIEDIHTETITINVPENTQRGTYYLDYYVELVDGQKIEKTLSFYVG